MKTKYYKVKSKSSSHKNQIGKFVNSFIEKGEEYHTLRFNEEEFRSYPSKNLKEFGLIKEIERIFSFVEDDFRKNKDNKLKRSKDFNSNEGTFGDIFEMLDYLATKIEEIINKK